MELDSGTSASGVTQLRRRWAVPTPRAAILLVHGIGEHSGRYQHVGRFFADRGYDVEAFDNRGFGESGGRRGHIDSFSIYLDDIEERLDARRTLGVPTVLFGHSLGGLMSASYLSEAGPRDQPDYAVLSSPALSAEVPMWQRVAAPVLGRLSPKLFVPSDIDGAILTRDVSVQQAYTDDPLRVGGATAGLGLETLQAMKTVSESLDRITTPTYVLHGAGDQLVPIEVSQPLEKLPSVTYRAWPGLLHECLNEPEQNDVMAEIDGWLTDQLAGQTG
jgi:alpha-beta hydrolase superfamily lysophospholipase